MSVLVSLCGFGPRDQHLLQKSKKIKTDFYFLTFNTKIKFQKLTFLKFNFSIKSSVP